MKKRPIQVLPLEPCLAMDREADNPAHLALTLPLSRAALEAFASAAEALSAAAKALLGQGPSVSPSPIPLSLSPFPNITLTEAINEFLLVKHRAGRSDDYLKTLRISLRHFAADGRGRRTLSSFTVAEIETWMNQKRWKARTRRGYVLDVRTMMNFATRRGWLSFNPCGALELPILEERPPAIHTPDQVRHILAAAKDPSLRRHLAIRYFAGLRTSEALRLEESEILLDRGFIEVTAAKSKTRRRRLIKIQDNLRAWLNLGGTLPLPDPNTKLWRISKAAGVPWPKNVTRHSFCSYHLAQFDSAAKTALEAGHSEAMLFAHYRELVRPETAAEYWSIRPQ